MTKENAIKALKQCKSFHNGSYGEPINMAIGALKQEPQSPCDVCKYNPPSSTDGKPCAMCGTAYYLSQFERWVVYTNKHNPKVKRWMPFPSCQGE